MQFAVFSVLTTAMLASAAPAPEPQTIPIYDQRETFVVDDGNPQQVYLYKQLSDRNQCGDEDGTVSCSVGESQLTSYSVSWGADLSAAGWISAGFSVSKSETTGSVHTCNNDAGDGDLKQSICIWRRVGHTEYTVKDWKKKNIPDADWEEDTDEYQMWSPNTDNVGYDYVCAWDDECQTKGDEWWGPSRTPGGPMPYPFDDRWQ